MKITDDMLHRIDGALTHLGSCGGFDVEVECLREALDAARRTTPDREAWQPIETAPRDGTPIIGCTFHPQLMHLYAPCTIFWAAYHPNSEGEKTWRTSAICGNKMKGVTHWMPLPTAPTSDKGGA